MSRATCLAMLCLLAVRAHASPRTDPTAGRAVFTGAVSGNATSIDINPAAIGLGPSRASQLADVADELYIAGVAVLDQYSIDRRTLDLDTGALSPGARVRDITVSPGATFAGIFHTGSDGSITLGFQARTAPGERFLENEALRYHTLGGYHRTISPLTIAGSVRITSRVYIGVSLASQSTFLKLRYARDTALAAGRDPERGIESDCGGSPCGVENPLADERYEVDVGSGLLSTAILAANLGAVVRVASDTWLGVGLHFPPGLALENELVGTVDIRRAPRDGSRALRGASTVNISQPFSVDAGLRARLPHLLDLHVGLRWEHLSRFQSYDVRAYGSTLPGAGIPEWQPRPRGFSSTTALWAGIEQVEHSSPLVLGGRVGIETAALEDSRTSPMTVAPLSLTLDLGAQYRIAPSLVLQATYGLAYFPPANVTSSAYDPRDRLACVDAGFDYTTPACASVRGGYAIPTAAGDYQRLQHALRLAVRIELP